MKNKNFIKHHFLKGLLCLGLLLLTASPVFADEGDVTGSFGTAEVPQVISILIHDTGTTDEPGSLTPMQTYDIKVTVTKGEGLGELDNLVVKLFADTAGNGLDQYTESNFDAATADLTSAAVITWSKSTNSAALDAGESESWALGTATLPPAGDIDGEGDPTSFTFVFPLTIGKIARETDGDYYEWYLAAKVTDASALSEYGYFESTVPYKLMNWYGEMTVPDDKVIDWGGLPAGTLSTDDNASERLAFGMRYIANGGYMKTVKTDTVWTADPVGSVTLTENLQPTGLDEFYLRAYYMDSYALGVTLDADGQPVYMGGVASASTNEIGFVAANENLWIALSTNMTIGRVYSGAIYYGIVNN